MPRKRQLRTQGVACRWKWRVPPFNGLKLPIFRMHHLQGAGAFAFLFQHKPSTVFFRSAAGADFRFFGTNNRGAVGVPSIPDIRAGTQLGRPRLAKGRRTNHLRHSDRRYHAVRSSSSRIFRDSERRASDCAVDRVPRDSGRLHRYVSNRPALTRRLWLHALPVLRRGS
jgi:hypothetical protein